MKTLSLIIGAASLGLLGVAGAKPEGGREGRKLPEAIVAKFDKDGDGKLNKEEREAARAAREAMMARVMEEFDVDKDGELSEGEREAMRGAILAKFDADGDGKLSKGEREAAREEFPMPRGGGKGKKGKKGEGGEREAPGAGV